MTSREALSSDPGAPPPHLANTGSPGADSGLAFSEARARDPNATRSPTFVWTLITILSPVVLMLVRAAAAIWMSPESAFYGPRPFIKDPLNGVEVTHPR